MKAPIRIAYNEAAHTRFLTVLEEQRDLAQVQINGLRGICELEVTTDLLRDLNHKATAVRSAIEARLRAEFKKAGITSSTVINAGINGDLERFEDWRSETQLIPSEHIQFIEVTRNRAIISPNAAEQSRRKFETWIETQAGIDAYQAHLSFIDAANRWINLLPGHLAFMPSFSLTDEGVKPEMMTYDILAQQKAIK